MSGPWRFEIWRTAAIAVASLAIGLVSARPWLWAFLGALLYIALHLREIYRLERWLRLRRDSYPPEARGIWGEIYNYLYRYQRRSSETKSRLQGLLNRFQDSAAALPDAIVALRGEGEIEWFNPAAARLLGLDPARDRGQEFTNLLRYPSLVAYLRANRHEQPIEIPSPAIEGVRLQVLIVPYGSDERLLIARDVTELHRLEQVRRDFVANVSHELRTPLTVIAGYLESLSAEVPEPEPAAAITAMRQQALRMQHIVEDLLFLARLESTEGRPAAGEPVPMPELIATILEEARALSAGQHRIEAHVDEQLRLLGQRSELASAVSNIVFNAVRYTPAGGAITVRWYADAQGAHLEVEDTGPGIAPHHINRLTERFYRVDAARSRELGGTGLGLAIVKHVLNRHEGALRIESELGRCSRFTCDFPRERLAAPEPNTAGAA